MNEKTFLVHVRLSDWHAVASAEDYLRAEIEQFTTALFEFHGKGTRVFVSVFELDPARSQSVAMNGTEIKPGRRIRI